MDDAQHVGMEEEKGGERRGGGTLQEKMETEGRQERSWCI